MLEERCLLDNVLDPSFSTLASLLRRICDSTAAEFLNATDTAHSASNSVIIGGSNTGYGGIGLAAGGGGKSSYNGASSSSSSSSAISTSSSSYLSTMPWRWHPSVEPLLLALSNRVYLLTAEYGARVLVHAWMLIEVRCDSK
jgi:hypothetical protein